MPGQHFGDELKAAVPKAMAPGVVNVLEMVGIDQRQGQWLGRAPRFGAQFREYVVQVPSIVKAGQGVVQAQCR